VPKPHQTRAATLIATYTFAAVALNPTLKLSGTKGQQTTGWVPAWGPFLFVIGEKGYAARNGKLLPEKNSRTSKLPSRRYLVRPAIGSNGNCQKERPVPARTSSILLDDEANHLGTWLIGLARRSSGHKNLAREAKRARSRLRSSNGPFTVRGGMIS